MKPDQAKYLADSGEATWKDIPKFSALVALVAVIVCNVVADAIRSILCYSTKTRNLNAETSGDGSAAVG
jgi:hypothetical protein